MKEKLIITSIAIGVIALIFFATVYPYVTAEEISIKVTDKERVVKGSGDSVSSKYLIYTTGETFENTDCLARFKFNSSDIYGSINAGQTYKVVVYGWRVPFMSSYRNIVKVLK